MARDRVRGSKSLNCDLAPRSSLLRKIDKLLSTSSFVLRNRIPPLNTDFLPCNEQRAYP
ncbi:unnamed protein product [Mycena citricolor]|uniref:Uncharacterized protein n=1 Tax=Mycena citricolor TaxID=2018698 RepID=A0AAD2HZ84_9AGAR|nr:unnamed protein product [Mycena citricolor]